MGNIVILEPSKLDEKHILGNMRKKSLIQVKLAAFLKLHKFIISTGV